MKLASFFRGYWRAKLVGLIDLFVKCEHLYRIVANNSWYEQALKVFFFLYFPYAVAAYFL